MAIRVRRESRRLGRVKYATGTSPRAGYEPSSFVFSLLCL
uniref:Uncharacterized protein n=1 Tax=Anguilla anguilla TaxID=7936 RepID=A0A0E9RAR9_ANGAN